MKLHWKLDILILNSIGKSRIWVEVDLKVSQSPSISPNLHAILFNILINEYKC